MRELLARLFDWMRRDRLDRELREELEFHRQQLERDAASPVSDSGSNRHAARRRMGNLTAIREAARDRWSIPAIGHLQQDVRYALRGLRRSPAFSLTIVTTLALGLGANAAVFSLVDRLFNRLPAGVADAPSLRRVYLNSETRIRDRFNYPEWQDLKSASIDQPLAVYAADSAEIGEQNLETTVGASYSDADYWRVLGVQPMLGRTFTTEEARIEVPVRVVVISHALWQRRFGGRSDIVGQTLRIAEQPYDVIGVAPANFAGLELGAIDVWMPIGAMPMTSFGGGRVWYQVRSNYRLRVITRVPANGTATNLDAVLTRAFRIGSVAAGYVRDSSAFVQSGSIISARGPMEKGPELLISARLAWVSALVLLIACANIANLMLTRLIERRREIAVRLALGVSRRRLASQFVVETIVIAAAASVCAWVVGSWSGNALRALLLPGIYWRDGVLEARHLAALAGTALVTTLLIALVPILHVRKFAGGDALKGGARSTSASGSRLRSLLIFGQSSLAVVLLTGAALCAQSLRRVMGVDVGVDARALAISTPKLMGARGGEDSERAREAGAGLTAAAERLALIPGVEAVALSSHAPIRGYYTTTVKVSGLDTSYVRSLGFPAVQDVSPEYWKATGMSLLRGRLTTGLDIQGAALVAIVNETMAQRVWQGRDPIGHCVILYDEENLCRRVVGVVRDVHRVGLVEEAGMQLFIPLSQATRSARPRAPAAIIVRASPNHLPAVMQEMRRELGARLVNADLRLTTLNDALKPLYHPWQLGALLFTMLASLGLLVTAIGLYGVIAYSVRQRLHEIGIRMALGAERRGIVLNVLRQGVLTLVVGLLVGTSLALGLSRFMSALLYDTSLRDPSILAAVTGVMLAVAVVASIVPAWTAAGVDPVSALREE